MRCEWLPQDWQTRLDGGIAFYDGEPVIMGTSGTKITINTFPTGNSIKSVKPDDPLLDLASPKLGYVNTVANCYYTYRRPERKYKQTLTYGSMSLFDPCLTPAERLRVGMDTIFYSEGFLDMLTGKYPSVKEVLASFNTKVSKVKSRAISRNVCLALDSFGIIRVYYKMEEVGYIKPNEKTVRVPKGNLSWVISKYLSEFQWEID
jgi:hypothetical protein